MSEDREAFIQRMIEEKDISRTMAAHMWDSRQVGGDEREMFETEAAKYGFALDKMAVCKEYIVTETADAWALWQARAALAPAAVAVVMPEVPKHWELHNVNFRGGWARHAVEVARLNRRAIPVELLKKQYDRIDYAAAMNDTHAVKALTNELRALLGK